MGVPQDRILRLQNTYANSMDIKFENNQRVYPVRSKTPRASADTQAYRTSNGVNPVRSRLPKATVSSNGGFIALMSAIIISVLLLSITVSLGFSGFFTRFNILDSESKERSLALAEACGDAAILKISQNASYIPNPAFDFSTQTGGEDITVINADHCTIASVDTLGSQKAIKTQAKINKAYTNLRIVINSATFAITSWEECSNLTSSTTGC